MFGRSFAAKNAQLEEAAKQALTAPSGQYKRCHGKLS